LGGIGLDIWGFTKIWRSARGLFEDIASALFRERLKEIPKSLYQWWYNAPIYLVPERKLSFSPISALVLNFDPRNISIYSCG